MTLCHVVLGPYLVTDSTKSARWVVINHLCLPASHDEGVNPLKGSGHMQDKDANKSMKMKIYLE